MYFIYGLMILVYVMAMITGRFRASNLWIRILIFLFVYVIHESLHVLSVFRKGDIYLKETAEIICDVYEHSPVFRIGGDEFAAILMDRDFQNRDELLRRFDRQCEEKRKHNSDAWEKINVARGMAIYDPKEDESVSDVVRRADKNMYENKFDGKRKAKKPA